MKQRRTREEMQELLNRRKDEGLTYKALVEESGIPMHTIQYWAGKLRRETADIVLPNDSALVPVEVIDENQSTGLVLEFGSGVKLHISQEFSTEHLLRVVRLLSAAC